jgi:hypothetical protein
MIIVFHPLYTPLQYDNLVITRPIQLTNDRHEYNSIIEEFEKLYEQTPSTQRYARAGILNGMKQSKRAGKDTSRI